MLKRIAICAAMVALFASCRSTKEVIRTDSLVQTRDSSWVSYSIDDYSDAETNETMKVMFRAIKNLKDSTIIIQGRVESDRNRKEHKAKGVKSEQTEVSETDEEYHKVDSIVKQTPAAIVAENCTKDAGGILYYIAGFVGLLALMALLVCKRKNNT